MPGAIAVFLALTVGLYSSASFAADEGTLPPPKPGARVSDIDEPVNPALRVVDGEIVVGTSDRVTVNGESRKRFSDAAYPWRAIGKIKFGKDAGWGCTAALVGPRHILTNSHCVDKDYPIYFYPSYYNGTYLTGTQKTTWGIHYYAGNNPSETKTGTFKLGAGFKGENDWAIIVLNERAGDSFGWLGSKNFSESWFGKSFWTMVSYPNIALNEYAKYPLHEKDCAIHGNKDGYLQHACDSQGGASGSPMFAWWDGQPYIVAVNWGEFGPAACNYNKDTCYNVAVREQKFNQKIKDAKAAYP